VTFSRQWCIYKRIHNELFNVEKQPTSTYYNSLRKRCDMIHFQHKNTSINITHTYTRLMALFPGLPRWAGTRKAKPIWILLKQDSEWQWHQLEHMQVCTSLQTDNHASTPPLSFLQAMPFLPPNQQRQSTEGSTYNIPKIINIKICNYPIMVNNCLLLKEIISIIPIKVPMYKNFWPVTEERTRNQLQLLTPLRHLKHQN